MTPTDAGQSVEPIDVGPCRCPGRADAPPLHPDGDWVTFKVRADLRMGMAADAALYNAALSGVSGAGYAALGWVYLVYGIGAWSFVEDGKPVPITAENIDRFVPWNQGGRELAEAAHAHFGDTVTTPLRQPRFSWRLTTPPTESTSPPSDSESSTPTSSSPPSPSTPEDGKPSETTGESE